MLASSLLAAYSMLRGLTALGLPFWRSRLKVLIRLIDPLRKQLVSKGMVVRGIHGPVPQALKC